MNDTLRGDDAAATVGADDGTANRERIPTWDRYELVELLEEGPAGKVYRAVDRRLRRTVALTFVSPDRRDDARRVLGAARAQAGVHHEHVCRVFEVGEVDGRAYLVTQFIHGRRLAEIAADLDVATRVEIVAQVARAVQAAHAVGVIHRNLDPDHIMVEQRRDGRWHATVVDFGFVASRAGSSRGAVVTGAGDCAFLAPEQIRGAAGDRRTDVYGLGATLYAVVAEQRPHFGATRDDTERRILDEEPPRLGMVVPGTPADLETIAEVAMAKNPRHRYPSARAFADDLGRWLAGEPVAARPGGPLYRITTWARTRGLPSAVLALVLIAAFAATGLVLWHRVREARRTVLVERYRDEVARMDQELRSARMMPLHDTSGVESEVRRRLATVEATLVEDGSLARGPAYAALGTGYLMLRDLETAEHWLRAALDSGFDRPEAASALGRVTASRMIALQLEESATGVRRRSDVEVAGPARVAEAVALLGRRGPSTRELDRLLDAFSCYLDGRTDAALAAARASAELVPWLYEARQLEGDLLVLRSWSYEANGDLDLAETDLDRAGEAYARALEVARSDAWIHQREGWRRLRLLRLELRRGELDPELVDGVLASAAAAETARPGRGDPPVLAVLALTARAERLIEIGADPSDDLDEARVSAVLALDREPDNLVARVLLAHVERLCEESRGRHPG